MSYQEAQEMHDRASQDEPCVNNDPLNFIFDCTHATNDFKGQFGLEDNFIFDCTHATKDFKGQFGLENNIVYNKQQEEEAHIKAFNRGAKAFKKAAINELNAAYVLYNEINDPGKVITGIKISLDTIEEIEIKKKGEL